MKGVAPPEHPLEKQWLPEHALQRPPTPVEKLTKHYATELLNERAAARARATALKTIDPTETREIITKEEFRAAISSVMLKAPPK